VQINALINVYLPRFKRTGLPILAGVVLLVTVFVVVRRRRRMRVL
jgi:LPXTG-motif cell wall-anchored protein